MPKCQVGVVGTGVMATGTATLLICNRYGRFVRPYPGEL